jgi:hypothetical protein
VRAFGPWGVYTALSHSARGWWVHLVFETSLTLCVLFTYVALVALPAPQAAAWAVGAAASGRLAVILFPQLEGLEDTDYLDLEPATTTELHEDLQDWLAVEKAKMGAAGTDTCGECTTYQRRRGTTLQTPNDLAMEVFLDHGATFNKMEDGIASYDQGPHLLRANPEAPGLARRRALHDAAWRLTQVVKAADLGPDVKLFPEYVEPEPTALEIVTQIWGDFVMSTVSSFANGACDEAWLSWPMFKPSAVRRRRRPYGRNVTKSIGILAFKRWPYRSPVAFIHKRLRGLTA